MSAPQKGLGFCLSAGAAGGLMLGGLMIGNGIEAGICASALFIGFAILEASRGGKS